MLEGGVRLPSRSARHSSSWSDRGKTGGAEPGSDSNNLPLLLLLLPLLPHLSHCEAAGVAARPVTWWLVVGGGGSTTDCHCEPPKLWSWSVSRSPALQTLPSYYRGKAGSLQLRNSAEFISTNWQLSLPLHSTHLNTFTWLIIMI